MANPKWKSKSPGRQLACLYSMNKFRQGRSEFTVHVVFVRKEAFVLSYLVSRVGYHKSILKDFVLGASLQECEALPSHVLPILFALSIDSI